MAEGDEVTIKALDPWEVLGGREHRWALVAKFPTVLDPGTYVGGVHESILRSFHVLAEVDAMLARGDSVETVRTFIALCYPDGAPGA